MAILNLSKPQELAQQFSRRVQSPLAEFADMTARGLIAAKFKDDDSLFWADIVSLEQELAIATSAGRILRLIADEMQIPTVGRAAAGNIALR